MQDTQLRDRCRYHELRRRLPNLGVLIAVAGILVIFTAYVAPAATPIPKPTPTFAQQWAELVAAAKQEGNIVVAPPPSWQEAVGHRQILVAFQEKFGIKVTSGIPASLC